MKRVRGHQYHYTGHAVCFWQNSVTFIHQLGVLQKDSTARNIFVHPDRPGITLIDFECTTLFSPRMTLGSLSANRKRKLEFREGAKFPDIVMQQVI
jgi:hypothetical protein